MKLFAHILRLGRAIQRRERALTSLLTLAAVVSLSLAAYLFRPNAQAIVHYRPTNGPETYYPVTAPLAALAGALALGFALLLAHHRQDFPQPGPPRLTRLFARGWWLLLPGTALLAVVAETIGEWIGVRALIAMSHHLQFALLCGGIALVALGLTGFRLRALPHARPRLSADARREAVLVILLTLAALLVRGWRLDHTVRMMIDESHFLMGITYFWAFDDVKILAPMPTNAAFPFLFSYGQDWAVTLIGRSFAGLRAFSVLLGGLTVPALYLLARYLYDRRTATIAALVLIGYPPHIHYSRLALNNIADPLFGTLALGLIARALHTSRRRDYVLGGVALGMTQYFYEGGRLLFPLLAAAWLGAGMLLWRPRPSARGVILLALAFVLVAAPVYYTLVGLDFPLMDRLDKTRLDSVYWQRQREGDDWLARARHFHHALMAYIHMPENTLVHYYLYYGGKHPLVLESLVPLFLLGALIAAWRWWSPGVLPAGWIIANALGNATLVESAVSARFVTTFPAVALLIALGLRYTPDLIWPPRQGVRVGAHLSVSRLRGIALIAVAAGICAGQAIFYFTDHLPLFEQEARAFARADTEDALLRARHFPPGTYVHLVGDGLLPEADAQRFATFMADGLIVRTWPGGTLTGQVLVDLPRSVDHAFFVLPDDFRTQQLLVAFFGARPFHTTDQRLPPGKGLLLYYLPAYP